jgi:hypothetical protein
MIAILAERKILAGIPGDSPAFEIAPSWSLDENRAR